MVGDISDGTGWYYAGRGERSKKPTMPLAEAKVQFQFFFIKYFSRQLIAMATKITSINTIRKSTLNH